jgi:hypothetical protein
MFIKSKLEFFVAYNPLGVEIRALGTVVESDDCSLMLAVIFE